MAQNVYAYEKRWAMLFHYLNMMGLNQKDESEDSCLVNDKSEKTFFGQARVELLPDAVMFRYTLPMFHPLLYKREMLEKVIDLNRQNDGKMRFCIVDRTLCVNERIPFKGSSYPAAKLAAVHVNWLMGLIGQALDELWEMIPDEFRDDVLQKAEEGCFCEQSAEDREALTREITNALKDPNAPEDDSDNLPEWPEKWGDMEAFIALCEEKGLDQLSFSEHIKLNLAYDHSIARLKRLIREDSNKADRGGTKRS